ncbi:ATP-grasp domain-containing protein [Micromonospora sp. NPDC003197]
MAEHVLIIGGDRDLSGLLRELSPRVATSVICRAEFLPRLRNFHKHLRLVALRADAPNEEWIAVAQAVHQQHPVTRLASFEDRDQLRCAHIGAALGLSTHAIPTVEAVNDKVRMRTVLDATGVDDTAATAVSDAAELERFVTEHGLPCVVKPTAGEASEGVFLLQLTDQIRESFVQARRAARRHGAGGVMVERFHPGPQYSVEAFSEGGEHVVLGVVRKYSLPSSHVEIGHVTPPPEETAAILSAYVVRVLDALDVRQGPTHTEAVLTESGPRVIETHLRMGGDDIPALIRDTTGVDIAACLVRQTLGVPVLAAVREQLQQAGPRRASAIWFAASPADGILLGIDGLAEVRALDGVAEAEQILPDGERCHRPSSSDHRLAYVRTVDDDPEKALERARSAVATLGMRLQVTPSASEVR